MDSAQIICQQLPTAHRIMRVAVVTETWPPEINGVAMTISRMVAGLQQRGHQVQLVRPRQHARDNPASEPNFEEVLHRGVPIPRYENLKLGLPAKQALVRLWSVQRPDLVHVVTEGPLGWSALMAAGKLKIPCSSDFHTNFHSYSKHYGIGWLKKPIVAYLRKLHNKADCTLVPTSALLEDLEKHGYLNLRVVARGVDTHLFHPGKRSEALRAQWGVRPEQPVAIYVGRLAPEKNLPVVMRAFQAMQLACPEARLVLVGDGPERAALQAAHPACIFAGMRSGEDLAAHYASGDIFLFPSITETYGNVTVEAMASGLAVIAYDYAAAAEHIQHGSNGLLADFDNAEDFIQLAANLVNDPLRIGEFGQRARATTEKIDWECVHDEFEAALLEVIARTENGTSLARLSA
ncbi:MAG TPA: glycosyltransferase family 1 protein [Burkholderiales bacterium]|nr:glycosyltransferase family 1 protein [Burkholderiales bacterium]